jgi:hypothetical protein
MAPGQGRRPDCRRGAAWDDGAVVSRAWRRGGRPIWDEMGTVDSPARASPGGMSRVAAHAGARPGRRRAAPVAGQESTRASQRSSWVRRRHRMTVGGPSQRSGEAAVIEAPGPAGDREWSGVGFGELSRCSSSKVAWAATLRGTQSGHTDDLKCGSKWRYSGHVEEQRGMERGDE